MQYAVTIVLIIFPLFYKKKNWIRYVQLAWLWILIGGCSFNVDMPGYQSVFDNIEQFRSRLEPECFYNLMCMIFHKAGWSYQSMVMVWAFIFLAILDRGVVKLSSKPQMVYSFMMIYPLIDNIVQLKNFAGMAVLIYSMQYLLEDDLKSMVKYIVCICFAVMQHSGFAFYLILLLVPVMRKSKRTELLYIILLPILTVLMPTLINILGRMVTTDAVVSIYVNNLTKTATFFILICWQLMGMFILNYCLKGRVSLVLKREQRFRFKVRPEEKKILVLAQSVNICMMSVFALYMVDAVFQRLTRNIFILDAVALSVIWSYEKNKKEKYGQIFLWAGYLVISMVAFYFLVGGATWESNRIAMENNIFW